MENRQWTNWTDYFLNEKRALLLAVGYTKNQIIEKYKNDYEEYQKNEVDWLRSPDKYSFINSQNGLLNAIKTIESEDVK